MPEYSAARDGRERRSAADKANAARRSPANTGTSPARVAQLHALANGQGSEPATPRPVAPEGNGLPENLRAGIAALSGMDLSDVRVHRNSSKPAGIQAAAYAQGNDIHLGPGQERHLPHEAWHVVQQAQGRVKPTVSVAGTSVNDDPKLESEATTMGSRAAGHSPDSPGDSTPAKAVAPSNVAARIAQRVVEVFSEDKGNAKAWSDPVAFLKARNAAVGTTNTVVEEPGSLGITGKPDQQLIDQWADPDSRDNYLLGLDPLITAATADKDDAKKTSQEQTNARNRLAHLSTLVKKVQGIRSRGDAAREYMQSTKLLSDLGLSQTIQRHAGTAGNPTFTYHYDTGYLKISADDVPATGGSAKGGRGGGSSGSSKQARANALNGPFNRGWVRGHEGVMNFTHRYIEHIHVNKGQPTAVDIFHGSTANRNTADAYKEKFSVQEQGAIEGVYNAKKQEELAAEAGEEE